MKNVDTAQLIAILQASELTAEQEITLGQLLAQAAENEKLRDAERGEFAAEVVVSTVSAAANIVRKPAKRAAGFSGAFLTKLAN